MTICTRVRAARLVVLAAAGATIAAGGTALAAGRGGATVTGEEEAAPLLAAEDPARSELRIELAGDLTSGTAAAETAAFQGGGVRGGAALTLFLDPLTDDAVPLSLAPFLQRASVITLSLDAGAVTAPDGGVPGGAVGTRLRAGLLLAAEVYLTPFLSVSAAAGVRLRDGAPGALPLLPLGAALGLRLGDLRLALGGAAADLLSPAASSRAARATLELRAVFLEHIDLLVAAAAAPDAVVASLRTTYYPSRRLGLTAGGFGGGRASEARAGDTATFGLLVGLSAWVGARLALAATYTSWWSATGLAGFHGDELALELTHRQ